MGYRPNQPRPSAPTPAGGHDRVRQVVYLLVAALLCGYVIGTATGWLPSDAGALIASVVGALIGWEAIWRRTSPPALPDPRETARALTRARIRRELDEDRDRVAWILKTNRLESELGIPLSDYSEETAAIEARMNVRDLELTALEEQEKAEADAAARASQPPPPPPGRGASSLPADVRFIFGYPVDQQAGVVVVGDGSHRVRVQRWLEQRGLPLRVVGRHNLFTGRSGRECIRCGLGPHRYEGTHRYDDGASEFDDHGRRLPDQQAIRERLTSAEPVRILPPGTRFRRTHICTTVDCNGVDSPHCPMSKPCVCGQPGRGWPDCPQHPGLSPL